MVLKQVMSQSHSGTFSQVYAAKLKHHPEMNDLFALKHIIPTSHPSRIESELRCMKDVGSVRPSLDQNSVNFR